MLRNARCCCRQRQSEASASYTQSENITGKLSQAAEATVRRQSGTTHAMPQLTMWCTTAATAEHTWKEGETRVPFSAQLSRSRSRAVT